jgi:hypothetical protein
MQWNALFAAENPNLLITYGCEYYYLGALGVHHNTTIMETYTKKDVGLYTAVMDFIIVLCLQFFIWHLMSSRTSKVISYNKKVHVNHYAVEVTNLPADLKNEDSFGHRADLKAHFEALGCGDVVDVVISHGLAEVTLFERRGELKSELRAATAADKSDDIKVVQGKLASIEKEIEAFRANPSVAHAAYVVFFRPEYAANTLRTYSIIASAWCCIPKRFKFKGKLPRVTLAPEPSNILFDNLGVSDSTRRWYLCRSALFSVLLVALSTGVNLAAAIFRKTLDSGSGEDCQLPDSWNDVNTTVRLDYWTEEERACFCKELGGMIWQYHETCRDHLADYATAQGVLIGAVFTVILVNYLLKFASKKLVVM